MASKTAGGASLENEPPPKRICRTISDISFLEQIATKQHIEPLISFESRSTTVAFDQEIFIPEDILLLLFHCLTRTSLTRVKCVCKYWNQTALHPCLAWRIIAYPRWIISVPLPTSCTISKIEPILDATDTQQRSYKILDGSGKQIATTVLYESDDILLQFIGKKTNLKEERIFSELFSVTYKVSSVQASHLQVEISLNLYQLEKYLFAEPEILSQIMHYSAPFMRAFFITGKLLHWPLTLPSTKAFYPPARSKLVIPDLTEHLNCELYKYQNDAVAWMVSAEQAKDQSFKYLNALTWPIFRSEIVWNKSIRPIGLFSDDIVPHIRRVNFRGGVLADEMGLGKTIELLGLIFANPRTASEGFLPNILSLVPNIKIPEEEDVRPCIFYTSEQEPKLDIPLFKTKTSLVICPNHLVKQWKTELENHAKKIKVYGLSTITNYKAMSYQDVVEADVIVISFQLLQNANYVYYESGTSGTANAKALIQRNMTFTPERKFSILETDIEDLKTAKGPLFEAFEFHRIILDEGHEVVTQDNFKQAISGLKSCFRWYVSGTPFPNEETIEGIIDFFNPTTDDTEREARVLEKYRRKNNYYQSKWIPREPVEQIFDLYLSYTFCDLVLNNLYWRNTKESISVEEFSVPNFTDEVILLDFHPVEAAFYFDATIRGDEERQRQLSNSPHLSTQEKELFGDGPCTLEQMRERKLNELLGRPGDCAKLIAEAETKIAVLKKDIEALGKLIDAEIGTDDELSEDLEARERKNQPHREDSDDEKMEIDDAEEADELLKKKKMRMRKRKYRAKKRGLRKQLALIDRLENDIQWSTASAKKFGEIKPELEYSEIPEKYQKKTEKKEKKKDSLDLKTLKTLKVVDLKKHLTKRGLSTDGLKPVLFKRLEDHLKGESTPVSAKEWKDEISEDLVQLHGTKLASTVNYLQKLFSSKDIKRPPKVLIFSQFSKFLHQVSKFLEENGVMNVFIEGNVIRKEQAISRFRSGEIPVMMLSLDHAASGTNLTEATHVILLDPIQGTLEESRAIEDQAIGRAFRQGQKESVTVVRFLIKNTLEHGQYLQRLDTSVEPKKLVRTQSNLTRFANDLL